MKKEILISTLSAALAMFIALSAGYFSNSVTNQVKDEVDSQVKKTQRDIVEFRKEISMIRDSALASARDLEKSIKEVEFMKERIRSEVNQAQEYSKSIEISVQNITQRVNTLTTDEITKKINKTELKLTKLSGQLEGLQAVIDPKNASQILNVARMQQEILEREKLEGSIDTKLKEFGSNQVQFQNSLDAEMKAVNSRITTLESELRKLLYWIMGIFVSVLAGFIAVFGYFGKKLTQNIHVSVPNNTGSAAEVTAA